MKKPTILAIAVFLTCLALAALIAWASGYNFDHRSPDVAFFLAFSIVVSGMLAGFARAMATEAL